MNSKIPLKIALAQINPIVGDLNYNRDKILENWKKADEQGADLIVFSELVLSGYPPEDLIFRSCFLDEIEARVEELVRHSSTINCALLLTTPWRRENPPEKAHGDINHREQIHNVLHVIYDGKIQNTVFKYHMATYGVFDEDRTFIPAAAMPEPVEFKGVKLGILICEDFWRGDVEMHLAARGAEVLIVPNGSPFTDGKHEMRLEHAKACAQKTGLPVVYVNQVGGQDELVFDGGSFVMGADGEGVEQLLFFEEQLEFIPPHPASTNLAALDKSHHPSPSGRGQRSLDSKNLSEVGEGLEFIYSALTLGIRDYVTKNNFPGVIIGLSGGVDSALTAVLAVDALGADRVSCVRMPSRFTSDESMDDAQALADNLGAALHTISIEESLKAFENTMPLEGLAHENIQSRIRGTILMALSNSSGSMVLSTGNKSEMAVGYATLYGDMNGGFNALKDIYKTQVYELCRWRNEQSTVIPEQILTKAPSAELRDNQTDQDSLPDYDVLDAILKGLIEDELGVDDVAARGFDREIVAKVLKMLDRAEYKRTQACPGVKITTKAFGRDRRYPMTNGFSLQF